MKHELTDAGLARTDDFHRPVRVAVVEEGDVPNALALTLALCHAILFVLCAEEQVKTPSTKDLLDVVL